MAQLRVVSVLAAASLLHFAYTASAPGFALKPSDVTVHFPLPSKTIYSVCMPEFLNSSVVWMKGGKKLVNDNRVSMTYVSKAKRISVRELKLQVREARLAYREKSKPNIHILQITNPTASDAGQYSCSVVTPGQTPLAANFQVVVSQECPSGEWKCAPDGKCLRAYQICNGIADCSNNLDERTGCAAPVTPTNLRMESASSAFIDSIRIRWNKVAAATAYEVAVQDARGNDVTTVTLSAAYPGVEISGLKEGKKYSFKVRSKTRQGTSDYSPAKSYSTLPLGTPGSIANLTVVRPRDNLTDHVVSWQAPRVFKNHPTASITYTLKYCQMAIVPQLTNTTSVRDGKGEQDNTTRTKIQQPIRKIEYKKKNCKIIANLGRSLKTTLAINVSRDTLFSFVVTPVGLKQIQGPSREVRVVVMPPTTYAPSPTEFTPFANGGIGGVMLFGIVTGGLVLIILIAFIIAYACKMSIVQDDVNLHDLTDDEDSVTEQKYEKLPSIQQQYDNYSGDAK